MTCVACMCPMRPWFSHENYPVFNGCTDGHPEWDDLFNFSVGRCERCGLVQQTSTPSLALLYKEPRAFGYGKTWEGHYDAFAEFIRRASPINALEIGGGNGVLLKRLGTVEDVEPFPQYSLPNVTTHKAYFHDFDPGKARYDVIYASHLIEHVLDPTAFLRKARHCLAPGGRLIVACPDFSESLWNVHLNAFTPDHFNYFTPESLRDLGHKVGLGVTRFERYKDHGMYLEFREGPTQCHLPGADIEDLWERYQRTVAHMGKVIDGLPDDTYLFGAHTFTITMLRHLKNPGRFSTVLDNEPTKCGRRLTGTGLRVKNPSVLTGLMNPTVALYMGTYSGEIAAQIKDLEPSANVVRLT